MTRPLRVRIKLSALRHNLNRVRMAAPESRVMAVVKANGYGHGLERVATALADVDGFGVACLEEAIRLREAGISRPITLLEGFYEAAEIAEIARLHLDIVVHHEQQLAVLERRQATPPLRVWLKIDSGMHRLGFPADQAASAYARLKACDRIEAVGLFSHLAAADDRRSAYTRRQLEQFIEVTRAMQGARSLANSGAILAWPDTHFDWVRPGLMLYGISPFAGGVAADEGLQPVMTLTSRLIAINHCKRQDAIGYGHAWVCPQDMPVGIVAAGYGDGYPRHAVSGTTVLLNGRQAQIIGRVSMDMLSIDLRAHPDARVGDEVVLWGDGLPVEEVAHHASTIPYQLVCAVAPRVAEQIETD